MPGRSGWLAASGGTAERIPDAPVSVRVTEVQRMTSGLAKLFGTTPAGVRRPFATMLQLSILRRSPQRGYGISGLRVARRWLSHRENRFGTLPEPSGTSGDHQGMYRPPAGAQEKKLIFL